MNRKSDNTKESGKAYFWEEKSVRWYENASKESHFHEKLSELIMDEFREGDTVCDMACGLGLLSAELAKKVKSVMCYDTRENAVKYVKDNAARKGLDNLFADRFELGRDTFAGDKFDVLVTSFFGEFYNLLDYAKAFTDKKVIDIRKDSSTHNFSMEGKKHDLCSTEEIAQLLEKRGLSYRLKRVTLDFGQPFTDLEDAENFMRYYDGSSDRYKLREYLEDRLVRYEKNGFEWYLPSEKKIAIFVIDNFEL